MIQCVFELNKISENNHLNGFKMPNILNIFKTQILKKYLPKQLINLLALIRISLKKVIAHTSYYKSNSICCFGDPSKP